jgi:hypothetical protein
VGHLYRQEMLRVRDLADKRMLPTSLYRGKRMIGYRESLGGDNKWHAQVVLEGPARVLLDEAKGLSSTLYIFAQ